MKFLLCFHNESPIFEVGNLVFNKLCSVVDLEKAVGVNERNQKAVKFIKDLNLALSH